MTEENKNNEAVKVEAAAIENKADKKEEKGCCEKFNPEPWTDKEIVWQDKMFVKDRVFSLFHIPVNFGSVVNRNMRKIEEAGAAGLSPIMLSDENSFFGADVYIEVNKEVGKLNNTKISGTFLSKVFEGSYKDMGKWVKEMKDYVKAKSKEPKRMLFYYTTCPDCAKLHGKNYVVILAEI